MRDVLQRPYVNQWVHCEHFAASAFRCLLCEHFFLVMMFSFAHWPCGPSVLKNFLCTWFGRYRRVRILSFPAVVFKFCFLCTFQVWKLAVQLCTSLLVKDKTSWSTANNTEIDWLMGVMGAEGYITTSFWASTGLPLLTVQLDWELIR
jgi:hypothetical protein